MALVVFFQEDEDVLIVYRNLKIFCETAPWVPFHKDSQELLICYTYSLTQDQQIHRAKNVHTDYCETHRWCTQDAM